MAGRDNRLDMAFKEVQFMDSAIIRDFVQVNMFIAATV
jgi:hypothetical protein